MARFITVILAAVASMASIVSAGCSVDILNFNQAAVGNACIPQGGEGNIWVASTRKRYYITASQSLKNQVLPADWSLQFKGRC
ncbi:hypothetical protein SLS58_002879 [Diplodia intermedia]|uniref:ToxB-like N-terminal ascomycota domain-containing protein n=1 Tax=Diplodia intermedia TaxID=856260 RepID=A0ABR3TYS1_9PEZI